MYWSTCTELKTPEKAKFTGNYINVCFQCGNCCMSPFWHPEFIKMAPRLICGPVAHGSILTYILDLLLKYPHYPATKLVQTFMHHLKQQWWQLELHKFWASCSRFEIPLRCLLLNDANSIAIFDQNMRTPCYKLVWLMQFIVNNNQKYFTDVSYQMELLSHPQTQYNTNSHIYLVNIISNKH